MTDYGAQDNCAADAAMEASAARSAFFPGPSSAEADPISLSVANGGLLGPALSHTTDARPPSSKEALRLRLYVGLVLVDAFCIFAGFLGANAIRFDQLFAAKGLSYSATILPPFFALALANGAYSLDALEHPPTGTWRAVRALSITVVALLIALFLSKSSAAVSRVTVGLGLTFAAVAMTAGRLAYGKYAGELAHWNFLNELLLVDGISTPLTERRHTLFVQELGISPRANDPETLERLGKLLQGFDRVLVAAPLENRLPWRETLKGAGIDIELLAPELEQFGAIRFRRCEMGPALLVAPGPLRFQERITKRVFDLVVGSSLLLLVAPLMLAIALAIKLTSDGPILFRQRRLGRANRQFEMLKFRSMYIDRCDPDGTCSALLEDDRVMPLGRLLRRTSLDELPQLINVLKGEMSLVGPRPHAIASTAENSLFWNIDGRYWHRGAVKPGITGLAQVRGYRGATRTTIDVMNRVNSDLEYLVHWSIWRDIKILVRTASVLAHQNAY
jgi:exopolysaccharide biosynthesis polyprenyl glycosylphosphotransferase